MYNQFVEVKKAFLYLFLSLLALVMTNEASASG